MKQHNSIPFASGIMKSNIRKLFFFKLKPWSFHGKRRSYSLIINNYVVSQPQSQIYWVPCVQYGISPLWSLQNQHLYWTYNLLFRLFCHGIHRFPDSHTPTSGIVVELLLLSFTNNSIPYTSLTMYWTLLSAWEIKLNKRTILPSRDSECGVKERHICKWLQHKLD